METAGTFTNRKSNTGTAPKVGEIIHVFFVGYTKYDCRPAIVTSKAGFEGTQDITIFDATAIQSGSHRGMLTSRSHWHYVGECDNE